VKAVLVLSKLFGGKSYWFKLENKFTYYQPTCQFLASQIMHNFLLRQQICRKSEFTSHLCFPINIANSFTYKHVHIISYCLQHNSLPFVLPIFLLLVMSVTYFSPSVRHHQALSMSCMWPLHSSCNRGMKFVFITFIKSLKVDIWDMTCNSIVYDTDVFIIIAFFFNLQSRNRHKTLHEMCYTFGILVTSKPCIFDYAYYVLVDRI
jgi:hypothetical protein